MLGLLLVIFVAVALAVYVNRHGFRGLSADVIAPKVGLGPRRDVESNQKDQAHHLIQSHRHAIARLRHNLAKIERSISGWRRSGAKSGRHETESGRDDSGYRVIEAENGIFAVELWQSGNCLYEADGFQTREQAEAWIIPVEIEDRLSADETSINRHHLVIQR
jgi:hypothetical protein